MLQEGVTWVHDDTLAQSSDQTFKHLFKLEAGLSLYLERTQDGFPAGLSEVVSIYLLAFPLDMMFRWVLKLEVRRTPSGSKLIILFGT